MTMKSTDPGAVRETSVTKKPYARPELVRYGTLAALTANVGSMTVTDGGTAPKTKTA